MGLHAVSCTRRSTLVVIGVFVIGLHYAASIRKTTYGTPYVLDGPPDKGPHYVLRFDRRCPSVSVF